MDCVEDRSRTILFMAKQLNFCTVLRMSRMICRQLIAGHVVSCQPMKRKKELHQTMIVFNFEIVQAMQKCLLII